MEAIKERKITLKKDQVNYLMNRFGFDGGEIIDEDIEYAQEELENEDEQYKEYRQQEVDLLKTLKGFTIWSDDNGGNHVNDSQMVDYDFTFTSPSGAETYASTSMCLMVGFNYHESLEIIIDESSETIREREEEAQRKEHEKQQKKKAKRGKSNSKWFDLIGEKLIDKSPEEMYDILKEYKFPKKHDND